MTRKETVKDLAMFGAAPAFETPLHVGTPNIGHSGKFLERVQDLLQRRWLTNDGPYVREFEKRIAAMLGVKHCAVMCNATIALEIAIRALDLKGEVIIPSFTFIATAHSLQWQEITPVFADVDERTHTLDPASVERMITPRTSGIIGVHVWGRSCHVDALQEIAGRHNLRLMFDAAHAFGCSHRGTMVGNFGDCEVLSFHATKFLNTFEGGAIVTNNSELDAKVRLMKNFGFAGYDNVIYLGTNGKMNEVSAAMGLTGLESMSDFVAANRRNYHQYMQDLANVPGVSLLRYDEAERCNFQYVVAEVDEQKASMTRDRLLQALHTEHILARRYFYPGCHRMEPYRSFFPHANLLLPQTERVASRVLVLPTGTAVGPEQVSGVCRVIRLVVANAGAVNTEIDTGRVPAPVAQGPTPRVV